MLLSENQKRFIELEKKKKEYKEFFEELSNSIQSVADEIGIGGMFQDDEGTVYQIVEPEGRFVKFDKIGYVRTRREGEKRGDLSLTKARENGFEVK